MKLRTSIFVSLLFTVLLFGAFHPIEDTYEERESLILHAVLNFIKQVHVNPKPIDNSFSKNVYTTFLERIDGGKRFFIQPEIDKLSKHTLQIDEQTNARSFEFFDESLIILNRNIGRAEDIFKDVITNHEFDFEKTESIELENDKKEYAKDDKQLREVWRKYLKYDMVLKFNRKKTKNEKAVKNYKEKLIEWKLESPDSDVKDDKLIFKDGEEVKVVTKLTAEEILKEVKEKTEENFTDWFERLHDLERSDRFETYLGAITNYFDPHTDYFNPKEKQDFDINMGGKLEGIGARLSIDGEYTKIVSIIPGGPADQGKQLEVDDLITTVTQETGDPIDITGWKISDVVQQIRGKKGTKVKLTVIKPDGTIKDIDIIRDRVIIDESFARSVILDLPGTANNIGYIKLPKFYSSFENKDGNSCARDVAKEIEKLKGENVNGIILDLRNNTGGSLSDVVDMTGLFIEEGPIVQVKPRERKAYVHKDTDTDVQYDGPLIVMTNHLSASASEILAAALQDYGRALIVGGKTSFGKGSVQRFFDIDRAITDHDDMKPLGNLKISMQKFYRVDGGSTQLRGVVPDIVLPDNYQYIETGEKEYDNALEWSEIESVAYEQNVVKLGNICKLSDKSKERLAVNEDFQLILENAARLKKNRDFSNFPISIDAYGSLMDKRREEAEKYNDLFEDDVEYLSIKNMAIDTAYINSDKSRIGRNEDWIDGLNKDIYLEETMHILRDLINQVDSYSTLEEKFVIEEEKHIKP
ncbi:MAG: carboxy terminal-processing peptidase [Saprospiraceae bacterium]